MSVIALADCSLRHYPLIRASSRLDIRYAALRPEGPLPGARHLLHRVPRRLHGDKAGAYATGHRHTHRAVKFLHQSMGQPLRGLGTHLLHLPGSRHPAPIGGHAMVRCRSRPRRPYPLPPSAMRRRNKNPENDWIGPRQHLDGISDVPAAPPELRHLPHPPHSLPECRKAEVLHLLRGLARRGLCPHPSPDPASRQ
jgi:hypothetical protein